jgi:hypothetical protein
VQSLLDYPNSVPSNQFGDRPTYSGPYYPWSHCVKGNATERRTASTTQWLCCVVIQVTASFGERACACQFGSVLRSGIAFCNTVASVCAISPWMLPAKCVDLLRAPHPPPSAWHYLNTSLHAQQSLWSMLGLMNIAFLDKRGLTHKRLTTRPKP